MNDHLAKLSDHAIMSLHRFYARVRQTPWGYKKFPNAGERFARLEEIIDQRIPAEHTNEILKLTQHA